MTFLFGRSRDAVAAEDTYAGHHVPDGMSWGSIVAGALTAVVAQLVLNLLGLGIGLSAINPRGGGAGAEAFSIGAGVWIVLSAVAAYAIGGYIAGRLSGDPRRSSAGYHGLVTWAVTTLVVVMLLTSAVGGILGGAFGAISGTFGGAGTALSGAAKTAAPQLSTLADPVSKILDQLKGKANEPDNVAARNDAIAAVKSALSSEPSKREDATTHAADALSKLSGQPVDQARVQIEGYERQYDDLMARTKDKATDVATMAASTASKGALLMSVSLIIGALAAFFAGRFGAVRQRSGLMTAA